MRDARRELSLQVHSSWGAGASLAEKIAGRLTSPSHAAMRVELRNRVDDALDRLSPIDRDVLVLRHLEELSNLETARVLGISPTAACNRYVRALERFKKILDTLSGVGETSR
jgi:RNA polymerase sigma-70 factor (ECF subfamily)